jgi:hypothetical protein
MECLYCSFNAAVAANGRVGRIISQSGLQPSGIIFAQLELEEDDGDLCAEIIAARAG